MGTEFTPGNIKRFSRQAMRGKWVRGIIVMLLYAVILNGPSFIFSFFTRSELVEYILTIYSLLVSGPLLMCVTCFFLDCFRGTEEPGLGSFSRGFSFAVKAIQLYILCMAFIFLWSMLFIIPGIIAAIRYSQSFFILADEPELSALDCIRKSKYMMFGIKGSYFVLQLSFIGWIILANIPGAVVTQSMLDLSALATFEELERAVILASQSPLAVALGLLVYVVLAYVMASDACFYDILSGNLKIYTEVPQGSETQGMY